MNSTEITNDKDENTLEKKGIKPPRAQKTTTILLSQTSFSDLKKNISNNIELQVPDNDLSKAVQTSHLISTIAHNELDQKIIDTQCQVQQISEKNFDASDKLRDKLIAMQKDMRRANYYKTIVVLGCMSCAAICIVISITGAVLGIHFIPSK